jgi:hypothetical protein
MRADTDLCATLDGTTARTPWLPRRIRELVAAFEAAPTIEGVTRFEEGLAVELGASDVLCVWIDWPNRLSWSVAGPLAARLQELVPEVAGSGHRIVLANAIIQPVGPAPSRNALLIKGCSGEVLQPHVVRTVSRVAQQIGPALDRAWDAMVS